jgi:hypothetical protein
MDHRVNTGESGLQGIRVQHIAGTEFGAVLQGDFVAAWRLRIADQQMDAVAAHTQLPDDFPADKTGSACD